MWEETVKKKKKIFGNFIEVVPLMGSCCRVQGTGTGLEIKDVCPSLDLGTQNCKKLGKSFQPYVPTFLHEKMVRMIVTCLYFRKLSSII